MTTIPPADIPGQLSRANDAIHAATGRTPTLWRPAGGLTDAAVNTQAGKLGLAGILWDVIPYDWINDSNSAATRDVLMTQIKPGSVVLFHRRRRRCRTSRSPTSRCQLRRPERWRLSLPPQARVRLSPHRV
jgi:peptidoglycan/xylan/chitin deacetylase (PgdA/CDA1 family)